MTNQNVRTVNKKHLLVRQIGKIFGAQYLPESTEAYNPNLLFLSKVGYTGSQFSGFSICPIIQSLNKSMPCLISSYDDSNAGHTWVIDGYKKYETAEITYNMSQIAITEFCRKVTTTTYLHFNYGWKTYIDYYALSDQTTVHSGNDILEGSETSHTVSSFQHLYNDNDVRLLVTHVRPK